MRIKTIHLHPDDCLAFRASVVWVKDDDTIITDDLDGSITLPTSARWAGEEALQIALHTGLAMSLLLQSAAKAKALGMEQEDYFSAVQAWDGAFILN